MCYNIIKMVFQSPYYGTYSGVKFNQKLPEKPIKMSTIVKKIYARLRLWIQPNKNCRHGCLCCKYFVECNNE